MRKLIREFSEEIKKHDKPVTLFVLTTVFSLVCFILFILFFLFPYCTELYNSISLYLGSGEWDLLSIISSIFKIWVSFIVMMFIDVLFIVWLIFVVFRNKL